MRPLLCLLCTCTAATVVLAAQQQARFSSRAVVVRVDVLATERGKPVAGLTVRDFEVLDNGVRQAIDLVDAEAVPVNAVLALDTSESTAGRPLRDLIAAGGALLDDLKPDELASITTFSHMVAPRVPLTKDHGAVRAVLGTVEPGGDTSAIDGTYVAMMSAQAAEGRPLVVVFTDGIDTASWMTPEELIDATRRASAVIYTVATGDARRWSLLNDLADATGGRAIALASSKDLRAEFERILTEFRSRYLLAFTPKGVAESGYHRLTVRATRSGINVKARPGYTAGK